jgi:hypothetical protein
MFCSCANAQITVASNGKVGLRSTTTADEDVYINGRVKISNGTSSLFLRVYNNTPQIYPASPNSGYVGLIDIPFQNMYSYDFTDISDKRQKENIRNIENPLQTILKLEGVKYDLKKEYAYDESLINDSKLIAKLEAERKNKIGFLAQDVAKVLPEVVEYDDSADVYGIQYSKIVPVLVEAIKELSSEIESLKEGANDKSAIISPSVLNDEIAADSPTLSQNIPNPFNVSTRIDIYIPEKVSSAKLFIYNMQGTQIRSFEINEKGNTSITIEGYSLKAGMYFYTLIADGREVDTKKMILTK